MIELKDVEKVYKTGKIEYLALKCVSLELEKGGFGAIVGPSGSGKTTLLNLIGCLDTPTRGKILVDKEDITNFSSKQLFLTRREKIGFIFQTFNLIQALTVYENIEFPLLFSNIEPKVRKAKVEKVLEELGLKDIARHKATDISGGQQQRVAIGRALIKDPLLVLADEPTGNLDLKTASDILNLIKTLNCEKGVTFLIATHSQLVLEYVNTVFKLEDGKVVDKWIKKK